MVVRRGGMFVRREEIIWAVFIKLSQKHCFPIIPPPLRNIPPLLTTISLLLSRSIRLFVRAQVRKV